MSLMVKDLIQIGEMRFREAGCSDPRLDAELLVRYILDVDKSYLFTHYGEPVMERICKGYFDLMDLRAEGVPLQYILGTQEFMGLEFDVNPAVLIPRQDTETLVELAVEELQKIKVSLSSLKILDICTGSGVVAISLACLLRGKLKMKITASDVSPGALKIAMQNAKRHYAKKDITFVEGDLFAPFTKGANASGKAAKAKQTFHLITGNPPYIPTGVLPTLQREIREHEPMLALDGGEDGLKLQKRILKEAPNYMKKGGILMLEIGHDQGADMMAMAESYGLYTNIRVEKDLAGNDRVFIASAR